MYIVTQFPKIELVIVLIWLLSCFNDVVKNNPFMYILGPFHGMDLELRMFIEDHVVSSLAMYAFRF